MDEGAWQFIQGRIKAARHRDAAQFTRFLDPAQALEVRALAAAEGIPILLEGGYEPAERMVAALGALPGDDIRWPIAAIELSWDDRFETIGHRDILGSLMALGLERDSFGDILPGDGRAWVVVLEELADFVCENFVKAGRVTLEARRIEELQARLPGRKSRTITSTVKSLRLDAIIATAFGLSREKAGTAIRAGLVKANHIEQLKPDAKVSQGDVFSLRGGGRAQLEQIGGTSKKGRIYIQIQTF